jgi:hypothetical protein
MIDLHTHTNCSDGDYYPQELIKLASNRGIDVLSITDHDTLQAYDTDIFKTAADYGIELISGIELSTIDEESGQKIHVVGLNIDTKNKDLLLLCEELRQSRVGAVARVEELLLPLGFKLRVSELLNSDSSITKFHIGHDVVSNPENHQKLIDIYGKIPLHGTFIEDYLIKGKPAFTKLGMTLKTSEAVDIIRQAEGVSICAHPSFNVMRGFEFDLMKKLIIRNGFDGVEAINIQYNKSDGDKMFDMVKEFTEFANSAGLLISGGSDYHSDNTELWGRHSDIGLANEKYKVTMDIVRRIIRLGDLA